MGTNNSDAFKDSPYLKRYVIDSIRGVLLGEWIDGTSNNGLEINADMVSESERQRHGCRIAGKLEIYKASGHFRIYPKEDLANAVRQKGFNVDLTHRIAEL